MTGDRGMTGKVGTFITTTILMEEKEREDACQREEGKRERGREGERGRRREFLRRACIIFGKARPAFSGLLRVDRFTKEHANKIWTEFPRYTQAVPPKISTHGVDHTRGLWLHIHPYSSSMKKRVFLVPLPVYFAFISSTKSVYTRPGLPNNV